MSERNYLFVGKQVYIIGYKKIDNSNQKNKFILLDTKKQKMNKRTKYPIGTKIFNFNQGWNNRDV